MDLKIIVALIALHYSLLSDRMLLSSSYYKTPENEFHKGNLPFPNYSIIFQTGEGHCSMLPYTFTGSGCFYILFNPLKEFPEVISLCFSNRVAVCHYYVFVPPSAALCFAWLKSFLSISILAKSLFYHRTSLDEATILTR